MSSDTTDFHPGYLHPDTLEIMQDDNRLASQLGRHHDHHAASQRHREALSEHSPAVTPVLTPRAVLSSAMLVSVVDEGSVLTVGRIGSQSLVHSSQPLRQERRLGREDASGGSGWAVGLVLADRGFIRQIIADTPADRYMYARACEKGKRVEKSRSRGRSCYLSARDLHLYIMPTLLLVHQHTGLPWYVNQLQACGRASAG